MERVYDAAMPIATAPRRANAIARDANLLVGAQGISTFGSFITRTALPLLAIIGLNVTPLEAALLAGAPRQIVLGAVDDRIAAEHDVAEEASSQVTGGCHHPAHAQRGADFLRVTTGGRPGADHFLQRDDVRLDAADDLRDSLRAGAPVEATAAVYVVGGHPQARGVGAPHRRQGIELARMDRGDGRHGVGTAKRGSSRMASALEGEKQASAAACQGSQRYCRCSRGASVTGVPAGTHRPKTCSVLCVTPGG